MSIYTTQQEGDLIVKYKGLVTSLAYNFVVKNNSYGELDDYIQVCYIGLLKAIRNYQGINSLSTMAWKYIRWEMLNHISRTKKHKHTYSFIENVTISEPMYKFNEYLPDLSNDESHILKLRLSGYTFMEIGTVIGYSRYTARNRYMSIVNKIKTANMD